MLGFKCLPTLLGFGVVVEDLNNISSLSLGKISDLGDEDDATNNDIHDDSNEQVADLTVKPLFARQTQQVASNLVRDP